MIRMTAFWMLLLFALLAAPGNAPAAPMEFLHFSADLPNGWSGEFQDTSDNGVERYMLVMGVRDEAEDVYRAMVSVFLLPPLPDVDKGGTGDDLAREVAEKFAGMQVDASEPRKEGRLWTFTGEPRTRTFKARAVTYVNADARNVLVVICQDPNELGAKQVFESLRGLTERGKELLGR
ncbi:MAG: protoporphyrinogen oxidase [Desulfovibrio sp.]|jgi:hypothetical protein|nr:protoporphyrinogen oxidase [Desulfovibrio sp.]